MKKLISAILAVLMLVSLCTVFVVSADEPTHELKAVVMMPKEEGDTIGDHNYKFRFIFSMTKADMKALGNNVDDDTFTYGFNCCWGISDSATHDAKANFSEAFDHSKGKWGFDEKGNLYYEIPIGGYDTEEYYEKAGKGELWGMICNYLSDGNEFFTTEVVHDAGTDTTRPHLKKTGNFAEAGNTAAAVVQMQSADAYYAAEPVQTDEPATEPATEPTPEPPQTADFSAAIIAAAVLALGATVYAAKKKH